MPPVYPTIPLRIWSALAWESLRGKHRSFRQDAVRYAAELSFSVYGKENIPQSGPALMVMNHYHRPGFQAYAFCLAISAVTPVEVHWTMTGAWTDDGTPGAKLRAWLTPHLFPRLSRLYGFTSMPPMPPRPHETAARAFAVRQILSAARQVPSPVLALSPEGHDNPANGLMRPPSGAGRLLAILDSMGFPLVPVGVTEDEDRLVLTFGKPFRLVMPDGLTSAQRDRQAADQVMQAIAALLPARLHGDYAAKGQEAAQV